MKLVKFTPENVLTGNVGQPLLNINLKSGNFTFSKGFIARVKISEKDTLAFCQDQDKPTDWYLCVDQKGFKVKFQKNGTMTFSCMDLAKKIMDSIRNTDEKVTLPVAVHPTQIEQHQYYAIITKAAAK